MKFCKKCKKLKSFSDFYKENKVKSGLFGECKNCVRDRFKKWRLNNKDRHIENVKKWKLNNPEKVRLIQKKWELNNQDYIKQKRKEWIEIKGNRERKLEWSRRWQPQYFKQLYAKSPKHKLDHLLAVLIGSALKGEKRGRKWQELVGWNTEQVIKHLESQFKDGMSWQNYGMFGWHIDHIKPKSLFNYTKPEDSEFKECWALKNLQPLWAKDNLSKHNKYQFPK